MREVILHIGMHKTGSSSIQQSLDGYDDGRTFYADLGDANHSVPLTTILRSDYEDYHIWKRSGVRGPALRSKRRSFMRALVTQAARADRDRLVLSGEGVSTLRDVEKRRLIAFFRDRGFRATVVMYVREPLGFAASQFQQMVKAGVDRAGGSVAPRYEDRLRAFAEALPEDAVVVRDFARERLAGGCVVRDFCEFLGLTPARVIRANDSLPAPVLRLLFQFNRTGTTQDGDPVRFRARQAMIRRLREAYAGHPKPDPALFAGIADFSGTEYMARRFGIAFDTQPGRAEPERLSEWLCGTDDIDLGPLHGLMDRVGAAARADDAPGQQVASLFAALHEMVRSREAGAAPDTA